MENKQVYRAPETEVLSLSQEQFICTSDPVNAGAISDITEISRTSDWD